MKIAFLGGTRFIGHAAAARALRRGHDVSVLHRGHHACEVEGVQALRVDRDDPVAVRTALEDVAPDVLVDTRCMNRHHVANLLIAVAGFDLPLVVLSSQDVYAQFGRLNGHPCDDVRSVVDETAPLTVPFPFRDIGGHDDDPDYDKKDVERAVQGAAGRVTPSATVLRLPAVYGSRDPSRRFALFVDAIDAGKTELPCRKGACFRWTHASVLDVAHAIVLAAEARRPGNAVYNVGERETPTMRERGQRIAHHLGARLVFREAEDVPDELSLLDEKPNDLVVSSAKLRDELGFDELTTERERLDDLIAGLRASRG